MRWWWGVTGIDKAHDVNWAHHAVGYFMCYKPYRLDLLTRAAQVEDFRNEDTVPQPSWS